MARQESSMKTYRHGDVIVREVDKTRGEKLDHLVLAEGEVTGHKHQITDGTASLFKFEEKLYLKIQSDLATLSHEEHNPLRLPKGSYEVIIQREYQPKGWTYVAD